MLPLFFDIESGPLPEAELLASMPEFEAAANLKDPVKIEASIAAKKAKWLEQAALSPLTGEILCIGVLETDGGFSLEARTEPEMLKAFWGLVEENCFGTMKAGVLVGWCCWHFDLPFLIKRSMKHGVAIPLGLRSNGRWHQNLVDAMVLWQMGDREATSGLDSVAKFLGIGAKTGDGADFAQLWKSDKAKASDYVENDLRLTAAIYEKVRNL